MTTFLSPFMRGSLRISVTLNVSVTLACALLIALMTSPSPSSASDAASTASTSVFSAVRGDRASGWLPQTRSEVLVRNGVVATSQPLAAQAGLQILQRGGNAIDAAVASAAVLNVLEPGSAGIGGDAFAILWL